MAAHLEAIIATAAEGIGAVRGVYVLAAKGFDAYEFAVELFPFEQRSLVEVHYAIVCATDTRLHAGRILYVDGGASVLPVPMKSARRIALLPPERAAARSHIEARGRSAVDRVEIEEWFRKHAAQVFAATQEEPVQPQVPPARSPYRAVAVNLQTRVLEVVADPFPSLRRRILVIDDEADTATLLRRSNEFDVTHIDEGWGAVEAVERTEYDAILCALRVGEMSGATLFRLLSKARPQLASRIAFLAAPSVVANAPPSSALGRVLARPVTLESVRALLGS